MPTAQEIFKEMPSRLNADKAGSMDATVLFDLSGDNGGQWTVAIANGECSVTDGALDDPKATIRMDADDYAAMATGQLNPMTAFMTGKVKVEGDLGTVMKFQGIFDTM